MPMLLIVVALMTAAIAVLSKHYRSPERRAVVVEITKDRTAMAVGGVVTAIMLVSAIIDGGPLALARALVLASASGGLVATLVHRGRSSRVTR